jgi:hypothetical protein
MDLKRLIFSEVTLLSFPSQTMGISWLQETAMDAMDLMRLRRLMLTVNSMM